MSPVNALDFLGRSNVQALGWTLVHFLWQGTLAALLLGGLNRLLRRRSPNVRYVAAGLILSVMLALPVVTFARVRPSLPEPGSRDSLYPSVAVSVWAAPGRAVVALSAGAPSRLTPGWRARLDPWLPALVTLWAAGVVLLSLRFLGGWLLAQRLKGSGVPGRAAAWQDTVTRLARGLGITRSVRLLESALVEVPTVIGWLRPVILLPASTLLGLSPVQLEALLVHELAHVRRYDYLVNLLQTVVETLLFFHPAVFWVSRHMRMERELCCDDTAVALCGDPVSYARTLADLEQMRLGTEALGMAATGGTLLERIARLLGQPAPARRSSSRGLAGGLALVVLLALSASAAAPRPDSENAVLVLARQSTPAAPPETDILSPEPLPGESREENLPSQGAAEEPAEKLSVQDIIALANHGVTAEYVDEMAAAGYASLTPQELIRLRAQGVSPDFVQELAALGYKDLSPSQLLTLRAHGVDADFIRELCDLGWSRLSVTHLVALRSQGVSPEYIREMKSAGLETISLSGFIALRSQGVSAEYMTELAEMGYKNLSLPRLIALRGSGVSLDYVREMKELGYEQLSVARLIALRGAGIDPEYVAAFKELGYDKLSVGLLIALRASGVTPDFAREMREAGYSNLSPQELIELRLHGVDPALARRLKTSRAAEDGGKCADAKRGKR
jgi:bla regulator protein blaR1